LKERIHIKILIKLFLLTLLIIGCEKKFNPLEPNFLCEYALVYNKLNKGRWQIFLNTIQGDHPKNISNTPTEDAYDPLWSLDGRSIAFRYDNLLGGSDIYLYDVFENRKINLTKDLDGDENPSPIVWTPDGQQIVYSVGKFWNDQKTCIMNKDGTNKRVIFNGGRLRIFFCDDGFHFIHNGVGEDYRKVYKSDIDGNSFVILDNEGTDKEKYFYICDFNPNTEEILLKDYYLDPSIPSNLLKYNIDTGEYTTLVTFERGWSILRACYSNDYYKVAICVKNSEESIEKLYLLQDGKLTKLVSFDKNEWLDFNDSPLQFSPEDKYIAYVKSVISDPHTCSSCIPLRFYLYIVNIATKQMIFIDEGITPQWNPLCGY